MLLYQSHIIYYFKIITEYTNDNQSIHKIEDSTGISSADIVYAKLKCLGLISEFEINKEWIYITPEGVSDY